MHRLQVNTIPFQYGMWTPWYFITLCPLYQQMSIFWQPKQYQGQFWVSLPIARKIQQHRFTRDGQRVERDHKMFKTGDLIREDTQGIVCVCLASLSREWRETAVGLGQRQIWTHFGLAKSYVWWDYLNHNDTIMWALIMCLIGCHHSGGFFYHWVFPCVLGIITIILSMGNQS